METRVSSQLRRTLLNIVELHFGICVLALVVNVSIIWILIQFVYTPVIWIALTVQFTLNGLALYLLIRFVKSLYYTALNTIQLMKQECAKECRRLRSRREDTRSGTINFWEADHINGSAKLKASLFEA